MSYIVDIKCYNILMATMKKLYRSNTDKKIAGICGGIGEYINIDSTVIRVIFVLLAIMTAVLPALIGYLVLAIVIPQDPKEIV